MVKAFQPVFPSASLKTRSDLDFSSFALSVAVKYSRMVSFRSATFIGCLLALSLSLITTQGSAALTVVEPQQENSLSEVRRLLADLSVKLREVERELMLTTGRLEESEFKNREIEAELKLLRKEIQILATSQSKMAAKIDSGAGFGPAKSSPRAGGRVTGADQPRGDRPVSGPGNPSAAIVALPAGTPAEKFDYAFDFIRKNDLQGAEKLLNIFAADYPDNPLTGNAYFWLGRVYLQTGRPQQAAEKLLLLIDDFADHDKRPDAFVDLAQALIGLDFKKEACDALYEFNLVRDQASGRLKSRAIQLEQEANCR